jgi:hypothetical protein
MATLRHLIGLVCAAGLCLGVMMPLLAQTPATAFYLQYRKAFEAARTIEDVMPYLSAATNKEVESTPPAERREMFEIIKMMGRLTDVKVTKEAPASNGGATLTVEALDMDKKASIGTITIVREGGAFKIGGESWSNK